MDIRRLRCFVALAEELHFHRAAERCHITQSAISQQLKTLEDELQVSLMYRTKRQVALTPAGEAFLTGARKTLAQAEQAVHLAQRTARGEIGQLLVGATAPALFILIPEIVKQFRSRLPEIGLIVRQMDAIEQEAALRAGDIEAGLLHPPLDDTSLHCATIARFPFALVMSDSNELAARKTLRIADLADQRFVLFPRSIGPRLYDAIVGACVNAGFSPQIVEEVYPAQSIIARAAACVGIGWIASELQQFPRAGIVYRRLSGLAPHLAIGVAYRSRKTSPTLSTFLAVAASVGRVAR